MNKIIELIKICLRWLKSRFRRKRVSPREEKRIALVGRGTEQVSAREQERFPRWRFRPGTYRGHNMPKRQACPVCGKWSKRGEKTMGGANYRCPNHGLFFVRRN